MLAAAMAEHVGKSDISRLPGEVVQRTIDLVISAAGSAILGHSEPIAERLLEHVVSRAGPEEASVIGLGRLVPLELAAMANATLTHVTEYEDVSWPEGQYTCNVIPALLSVGEAVGASGGEVISVIVAGFEVASQPALLAEGTIMGRGFLNSSCMGAIGVAAGAAKLLGLDRDGISAAITLCASLSAGLLRQTGSAAHVLESGFSAKAGVEAAQLAARGLAGMPDILDGERGFFSAHANVILGEFQSPSGLDHRIMAVGQKKYPCGYRMQRLLDGILRIVSREGLQMSEIEACSIHVNGGFLRSVRFPDPINCEEARLSMNHCVAACLARGRVDFNAFRPAALADPEIAAWRSRIRLVEHPEWGDAMLPPFERVELALADGRRFETECRIAHGDGDDPLSRAETEAKFRMCTAGLISSERQSELLQLLSGLTDAPSVRPLMTALSGRVTQQAGA